MTLKHKALYTYDVFIKPGEYYYQKRLRQELSRRTEKNPHYSLRSFAVALGVGASTLSLILLGKRPISTKMIERIFNALEFSKAEKKEFLESVLLEKKEKGMMRVSSAIKTHLAKISSFYTEKDAYDIGLNEFKVISDWSHYAIRELTESPAFKANPKWIASALGITEIEAKLAIDHLLQLGLIERVGNTLKKTHLKIDTKDKDKTSVFHQKRQKQFLEKSIYSVDHDPLNLRNHSSITFCINTEKIQEAKNRIQKFMWEMSELMVDSSKEKVYNLQVSLFPLQRRD